MLSQMFVRGFGLAPVQTDYPGARLICPICGTEFDEGCHLTKHKIIKPTTGDLADIFRDASWICPDCAAAFVDSRTLTSNVLVVEHVGYKPVVSDASATEDRPTWRQLIRTLPDGVQTVAIVTSNTKRRLWPRAVVSTWGEHWQPLFVDGDVDRLLTVNVYKLRECLDIIEQVYNLGFSKQAIASGLIDSSQMKAIKTIGLPVVAEFERTLILWRDTDEFLIALFVAQKEN